MSEPIDVAAMRARCNAATAGPWEWTSYDDSYESVRNELTGVLDPDGGESRYRGIVVQDADADFIAHARSDVPALLDALEAAQSAITERNGAQAEVERLRAENARWVERVKSFTDVVPRSALVQVGWRHTNEYVHRGGGEPCFVDTCGQPVYVIRTDSEEST